MSKHVFPRRVPEVGQRVRVYWFSGNKKHEGTVAHRRRANDKEGGFWIWVNLGIKGHNERFRYKGQHIYWDHEVIFRGRFLGTKIVTISAIK